MDDDRAPHPEDSVPVPEFPLVLRGYDRAAVRAFAQEHVREVGALRRELAALLQRSTTAEAHLAAVRRENQALREGYTLPARGTPVPAGTGARVERLLQLAEEEAAAVRVAAVRDAARLLERAQEQAEAHLRAAADAIEGERTAHGAETAQREAALHAAEERSAADRRAASAAAAQQRARAEDRAQQLTADAQAEADAVRARAEAEAEGLVARARAQADQLTSVGRSARADLARLLAVITEGLPDGDADPRTGAGATGGPDARPSGGTGPRSSGTGRVTDPASGTAVPDAVADRSGPAFDDGSPPAATGATPARLPHPVAAR